MNENRSNMKTTAPPTAVDLFSGAGGLAEGLLMAGIDVIASVELHPQAALTHAFNHPNTQVLVGDIRQLDLSILDDRLLARGISRLDLVAGGPPCQGFSSAGKKNESDPRNSLFRHYLRVVEHLRPRMLLIENVPGFKSRYDGAIYAEATEAIRALGYDFTDRIIRFSDFGVPQTRRRFVLVGWLPGETHDFEWPEETHEECEQDTLLFSVHRPLVTAGEALGDLAWLEPGFEATRYQQGEFEPSEFARERRARSRFLFNHLATEHREKTLELIQSIPPGGSIRDLPYADRRTKKVTMVKLHENQIGGTVVSLPDDLLHYRQPRILTVREAARLQTFDDSYVFFGKRTSGFLDRRVDVPQYTQVGNAVPPLGGKALGDSIARSLGAAGGDLRDIDERVSRSDWVVGSSGFAGYELAPSAKDAINLTTVDGEPLPLPVSEDLPPIADQPSLRHWGADKLLPKRGQWAPGVEAKAEPAWE
jgi:DNA (cytosine-5)-methyltransferase 1